MGLRPTSVRSGLPWVMRSWIMPEMQDCLRTPTVPAKVQPGLREPLFRPTVFLEVQARCTVHTARVCPGLLCAQGLRPQW